LAYYTTRIKRLILEDYRAFLAQIAMHSEVMTDHIRQAADLARDEQRYVLPALKHQNQAAEFEIAWVDSPMKSRNDE
jgi:hypothetical protein